jgi:hypothetical protein
MLEIRKTAVSSDERELENLGRIITDADEKESFLFLKKCVYDCILHSQQVRLKSHLDSANPVEAFKKNNTI